MVAVEVSLQDNPSYFPEVVPPSYPPNDDDAIITFRCNDYLTAIQGKRQCFAQTITFNSNAWAITGLESQGCNWQVALYSNSSPSFFWVFWAFAMLAVVVFCMSIASLCTKAPTATLVGLIGGLEDAGIGVNSSTFSKSENTSGFTFLASLRPLSFGILFWGIVTWFCNRTTRTDYGQPISYYFLFTTSYWFPGHAAALGSSDKNEITFDEGFPVEPVTEAFRDQAQHGQGLEVRGLRKVFRGKLAFEKLSWSIDRTPVFSAASAHMILRATRRFFLGQKPAALLLLCSSISSFLFVPVTAFVPTFCFRQQHSAIHAVGKSGGKLILTDEEFGNTVLSPKAAKPIMVFFTAPWCGPCRLSIPVVKEVLQRFKSQIDVVELCTDDLPEVASASGIASIPTIQLYYKGTVLDTIVGCVAVNVLASSVEKALEDVFGMDSNRSSGKES